MGSMAKDKKVAVVGVGGVGGYLAGMLGTVCPHLTLAARGKRKEALEEKDWFFTVIIMENGTSDRKKSFRWQRWRCRIISSSV